jgi:phosphoglycolate phosphatase-like HAD superfamily hydrolase
MRLRSYEEYLLHYDQQHDRHATIFPGIEALLGWVEAQRLPTGIVTAKGAGTAAITIRRLGLRCYFSDVEAGSPDGANKPKGIRMMLARWGRRPAEAVYVGDSPYDMRVGRRPQPPDARPGEADRSLQRARASVPPGHQREPRRATPGRERRPVAAPTAY